jgi:hypothetical protein
VAQKVLTILTMSSSPSQQHGSPRPPARRVLVDLAILIVVASVALLAAWRYVSSERGFYYWDNAMFQDATIAKALSLRDADYSSPQDVFHLIEEIVSSTGKRFSDLHTLPTAPFLLIFGASRTVYIAALTLCFTLPLALAIGAVTAKLIPSAPRSAFWCGTLIALVTPAVWLPSLRGYPDAGAAALIVFATAVYLQDVLLRRWWQPVVIGLCLALAILFQHTFLYDAVVFFVCIVIVTIATARSGDQSLPKATVSPMQRVGLTGVALLGFLAAFGLPFFLHLLPNARDLYSGPRDSAKDFFDYYPPFYGAIACLAAPLGLIFGWTTRAAERRAAAFVLLMLGISLLHWMAAVGKLDVPLTLHFTPWIVLGLITALWTVVSRARPATAGVAGLALAVAYLLANVAMGLRSPDPSLNGDGTPTSAAPGAALFAEHLGPFKRQDYAEVARLTGYLNHAAADRGPIYVAASSRSLNDDILWHANRTLHEDVLSYRSKLFWENRKLNILHWIPTSDERDPYPLTKLITARYVVIASPFQGRPTQKVVEVVVKAFADRWPFAQDFERLPDTFTVGDGVTVSVYRRLRPTSLATSLQTLTAIRAFIGRRPGGQPDWMNLGGSPETYVTQTGGNEYRLDARAGTGQEAVTVPFVYLGPLPARAHVTGTLSTSAPHSTVSLRLEAVQADGKPIHSVVFTPKTEEGDFDLSLPTDGATYLTATLFKRGGDPENHAPCWIGTLGMKVAAP